MESTEKRRFQRINVSLQALFYRIGSDGRRTEFEATIKNISERGIYFEVVSPEAISIAEQLRPGERLSFVFIDEFDLFGKEHSAVVREDAYIVRSDTSNEITKIGCEIKVKSSEIENYIRDKEIVTFLNEQKDY